MAEPHVVSALVRKRAELAGEVQAVEKHAAQFRADLVHLDAVLRMFDAEPDEIAPKRPYKRRQWFSDGELPRRILDTLRAAGEPLSATEIAARVMTQKGLDVGDCATLVMIRKCVQSYLRRQDGALVEAAGRKGRDGVWRVVVQLKEQEDGWRDDRRASP